MNLTTIAIKGVRDYLFNAIDEVDASVFSGDVLYNDTEREFIKEHCHRWLRAIDSHESAIDEE